jgi:U4/U6 small nuclear ribonucleoprotein PRP31
LHHAAAPGRTKLTEDATLLLHLNNIRQLEQQQHQQQQEYEHQLMTCSNKHLVHLTNELAQAHLDLCRAYSPKFPELQELIGDPVQYKNAVRVISNEMDVTKLTDQLNLILGSNQIITISVAASTSSGQPLTESELEQVAHCADYMDDIILMQEELTAFVESRITALAPSMCALVGPSTAAKLVGLAGGLAQLSNIPACNLQVMGQVKHSAASKSGLSSISLQQHSGILAESPLVQSVPSYLQKKALKVVAAKLALSQNTSSILPLCTTV